jgi:GR25 family glycosyltransferase involved in LPS biosynthesis
MEIKYYVIHCKEHTMRLDNINAIQLAIQNYKLNIFDGYNTKNNSTVLKDKKEYLKKYDINLNFINNAFTKPGEIGCYLSHHMLIKYILDNNYNGYSVIFEDDVKIQNTITHEINHIILNLNNLNYDWDIIFLGNLISNHGTKIINNIYTIDKNNMCTGTHGLLINNKNIKKIYNTNCNIINAIDWQYKKNIDSNKLNGLVIYPQICTQQNNVLKSTIQI